MTLTCTIPGAPTAKGRPRMTRGGHAYTPAKTRNYEAFVKMCFLDQNAGAKPLEGPVELRVHADFQIPKSWPKKRRSSAWFHTSRPDLDNIVKAVKDALNGLAWGDDAQVCTIHAGKRYTENQQKITVFIEEHPQHPVR